MTLQPLPRSPSFFPPLRPLPRGWTRRKSGVITPLNMATITAFTDTLTINAPSVGTYPHEPAGAQKILLYKGQPLNPGVNGLGIGNGQIEVGTWNPGQFPTYETDPTAPRNGGAVAKMKYPNGLTAGASPNGWFRGWNVANTAAAAEYSTIYVSYVFRLGDAAGFQMPAPFCKIWGYWGVGAKAGGINGSDPDSIVFNGMFNDGNPGGTMSNSHGNIVEFLIQGHVQNAWLPTVNRAVETNKYMQMEAKMSVNAVGQTNGTLEAWLGLEGQFMTKTHNLLNGITYRTAAFPSKFYKMNLDGVWGGSGAAVKTRDDFMRWNELYISGIP